MKSTIGAIALIGGVMATAAAIALSGTAAFAETAGENQRAHLASLWGQDKVVSANRTISSQVTFTAPDDSRSGHATGLWAGNYRAGRVHSPAGR